MCNRVAMTEARPTLANWLDPSHLHWSFRHLRELIPTARVRSGAVRELPSDPQGHLLQEPIIPTDAGPVSISTYLRTSSTDAFVVLADGRIVLEWYAPDVSPDEPHILMSVTKSITALLAGALWGAGVLDLESPVARYIPEAAGSCYEDATVRHLLDMTVGAAFVEDYTPGEDVRAYRQSTGWYPREGDGPDLHAYLCTIRHAGEHGAEFRYISINTDMLGWVCERAGGRPYNELVSEHLWVPMGAEADADVTLDRAGAPRAAGGLCVAPRDLARLGQLVIDDGAGAVPAEFIADLREGGAPNPGPDLAGFAGWGYRSSWYQPRWSRDWPAPSASTASRSTPTRRAGSWSPRSRPGRSPPPTRPSCRRPAPPRRSPTPSRAERQPNRLLRFISCGRDSGSLRCWAWP